jgi:hypothetical protein
VQEGGARTHHDQLQRTVGQSITGTRNVLLAMMNKTTYNIHNVQSNTGHFNRNMSTIRESSLHPLLFATSL